MLGLLHPGIAYLNSSRNWRPIVKLNSPLKALTDYMKTVLNNMELVTTYFHFNEKVYVMYQRDIKIS